MKKLLILLLLLPAVHAIELSDWPDFFVSNNKFSAKYVVGEESPSMDVVSATIISTSLAQFESLTTEVGTSKIDSEISDIRDHDAIVIGNPCENSAALQLLGNPNPCYKDLAGSVGYIKVFEHGSKVQILITGLNEKDRRAAAKFLADNKISGVHTDGYMVVSNSGSTPTFFAKKMKQQANTVSQNTTIITSTSNTTTENFTISSNTSSNISTSQEAEVTEEDFGPYEPIEEMPEEKGFWSSLWGWLAGLFS